MIIAINFSSKDKYFDDKLIKTGSRKSFYLAGERSQEAKIVLSRRAASANEENGRYLLLTSGACHAYQTISDISLNLTYLSIISTTARGSPRFSTCGRRLYLDRTRRSVYVDKADATAKIMPGGHR